MVDTPFVDIQQDIFYRFVVVIRVNAVGSTEATRQIEFLRVGIDSDNPTRFRLTRALNHCQTNRAKTKHGNRITWLDFSCVVYRANTGGHATAQQADVFMVCFWINFCQRHFRDYGVFTECRAPHVVIKRLPVVRKTGGAVWHQAFTLGFANRNTEVSFARTTELTLAALRGVKRDHMVARFDAGYAFTDFNHNAGPFVTENHREYTFRVIAGEGKCVGMANAGMGDFN